MGFAVKTKLNICAFRLYFILYEEVMFKRANNFLRKIKKRTHLRDVQKKIKAISSRDKKPRSSLKFVEFPSDFWFCHHPSEGDSTAKSGQIRFYIVCKIPLKTFFISTCFILALWNNL